MGRPLPPGSDSPTFRRSLAHDSSSDEHERSDDGWQVYSGSESGDEDLMEEEERISLSPEDELKQQLICVAADGEASILRLLLEDDHVSSIINDTVSRWNDLLTGRSPVVHTAKRIRPPVDRTQKATLRCMWQLCTGTPHA